MDITKETKKLTYDACMELVDEKITRSKQAMEAAQEAANNDTKSSAGDKYETGRAMMMLEKEKNAAQLEEAAKLKKVLMQLNPETEQNEVGLGSLIKTSKGIFYLSVGLGKINVGGISIFSISPASPIAKKLLGLKARQSTEFNGNQFVVESVI